MPVTKIRKKLLDTELQESVDTCKVHKTLVDVLLNVDAQLLQLKVLVFITLLVNLGVGGKSLFTLVKGFFGG